MNTKNTSSDDFSMDETTKNIEDNLEQPTQQTKRGIFVMMVLMGILALGLMIHSLFFNKTHQSKEKKSPVTLNNPSIPSIQEQNYNPATLERLQREAEERIRAQAAKDAADAERAKAEAARIQIENEKYAATIPPSTLQEMRRNWQLEDEKFALQSIRSPIVGAPKISTSTLPENSKSLSPSLKNNNALLPQTSPLQSGSIQQSASASTQSNTELSRLLLQLQQLKQNLPASTNSSLQGNSSISSDNSKPEANVPPGASAMSASNKVNSSAVNSNEQGKIVGAAAGLLEPKANQYLLPAGSVISAILDTELNTDFPGMWRGLIVRDVYDVANKVILVPKGAKVLGNLVKASSVNEPLHERVGLMVKWITLPDGSRINMGAAGRDTGGIPGVPGGEVDRHVLAQLFGVTAYAVFTILENITFDFQNQNDNSNFIFSPASIYGAINAPQKQAVTIGKQYASKYLNLVPTIKVPAGTPFKIFLEEDIYSEMWQPIDPYLTPNLLGVKNK